MDCSLLSMGFSRQEYQSDGLPFPPPGGLSYPGIKGMSPAAPTLQEDSLPLSHVLIHLGELLNSDSFELVMRIIM